MKLAKREKLFVGAGGGVLGLFLIIYLIIAPFFSEKSNLEKGIEKMEQAIKKLSEINSSGQNSNDAFSGLDRILENRRESLNAMITKAAKSSGIKDENIKNMKPSEKEYGDYVKENVRVNFDKITLPQLTDFLYKIERHDQYVFVENANINEKNMEEGYLAPTITIFTYKKAER